jgi:hypothetical protein
MTKGGFDVIIGNPPYIGGKEYKRIAQDVVGFATLACPDFYAVCYERSITLLNEKGWHSMIVMLSLCSGRDFEPLRSQIRGAGGSSWWSTYGKRPDSLFGVEVVNTIVVRSPSPGSNYMTSHNIFTLGSRAWLFNTLDYWPSLWSSQGLPLRGGVASSILSILDRAPRAAELDSTRRIYVKPSGRYWFPILPSRPPKHNLVGENVGYDERVKVIPLYLNEDAEVALAACAGKIGYLWWSSVGDDLDAYPHESIPARALAIQHPDPSALGKFANRVVEDAKLAVFQTKNRGNLYLNIRWSSVRESTDHFDRELLKGSSAEGSWRKLNIWYRKTYRSSNKSLPVSEPELQAWF